MTEQLDLEQDDFIQQPWAYPGQPLDRSGVLLQRTFHPMTPVPRRRLEQARVTAADAFSVMSLNGFLLEANAANVTQRTLVVAVGSNASPVVMHRKFKNEGVSTTIPFIAASLAGISISHSAHISKQGYIAAAPCLVPGATTKVMASLLDQDQLDCLDRTEPNYERREVDSTDFSLVLDGGERPAKFCLYTSRWGILASGDGRHVPFTSQDQIFKLVLAHSETLRNLLCDPSPRAAMVELAADERLRDKFRETAQHEGLAISSGLASLDDSVPVLYGLTPSSWETPHCANGFRCVPSADDFRRLGEQCVVVSVKDHQSSLLRADHVAVATCENPRVTPALARVVVSESQEEGKVGVDQIVRYALGLEHQEVVELAPVHVSRNPFADWLLTRPQFATMRVQTGDLAIVEQGVCLMDELTMQIIGVDEGAGVVIEAAATDGSVYKVRLHAHGTPGDTAQRRERLSGGNLQSRFPSAADTLGIAPDLPWIFLDSSARSELGLAATKLGTVRVRASRRYQLFKELRELLLVLVLAMIGIATVIPEPALVVLVALVFAMAIGWAVRHRLKSKLEATS